MVRKTHFAGGFYDANPDRLKKSFEAWFKQTELPANLTKPIGVIVPHAGYMYSGACAAYSYKLISQYEYKNAIIIHPSHRGNHFGYSISPYEEYYTPLGNLHLNKEWADRLEGADEIDPWYHQNEHSMEVQLPFLAHIKPDIRILPIMIGNQTLAVSKALAEVVIYLIRDVLEDTVIIVSTDLSHYHSAGNAEKMDGLLIDYLLKNEMDMLYNCLRKGMVEACGFAGVITLMYIKQMLSDYHFEKLHYTHSGYTSGDYSGVVGYLSAALIKKQ